MIDKRQIVFGKVDAKSEFSQRNQELKEIFMDSFTIPYNTNIDDILSGDKYIFHGTKGAGKTALLRYIHQIQLKNRNPCRFIVFQNDISDLDRDKLINGISETPPAIQDETDVTDVWRLYILNQISQLLYDQDYGPRTDKNFLQMKAILDQFFTINDLGTIDNIRKSIKDGYLKISVKFANLIGLEAGVNFEKPDQVTNINYKKILEYCEKALIEIEFPKDVKFYLFIDEINLSMLTHKKHKRDSILVRDLILSLGNLNHFFSEKNLPIFLYCAVRTEILASRSVSRHEINKYIKDHGQYICWHSGYKVSEYPMMRLIEKKIASSEKKFNQPVTEQRDIWKKYFSREVFGVPPQHFLSEITWCNPRDIVNLFNIAISKNPRVPIFDHSVFESSLEEYSREVWNERFEELNVDYNAIEITQIKSFLTRYHNNFKADVFEKDLTALSETNKNIMQLIKTRDIRNILKDLYYVGILGQSRPLQNKYTKKSSQNNKFEKTWYYRDGADFNEKSWLIVHNALRPEFKMKLYNSDFGSDPRFVES